MDAAAGMTNEMIVQTAIAFLDQFIARGAERDVRDVRDRLGTDAATIEDLLGHVGPHARSEWESFVAFRAFLTSEATRSPVPYGATPNLQELVGWMGPWEHDQGTDVRATADPAQWSDWLDAIPGR